MKGKRFANTLWVKIAGWVSVIVLIMLNMYNLPTSILGFFGDNPSDSETLLSNIIAYSAIVGILALLAWVLYDLHKTNLEFSHQAEAEKL
ncbi:hypothetical protein [Convivina praedatoris]|uniref:Uncharacterized protein n=1 Tax=Convivina praedatoris TaxID=2880963 RepID=A0ABM9D334_9LACO|nr:hypothetical protein [Convivina sp. LMG 32447]CAH1855910.1 hypothetical protein R077815_01308 [Convivina sp. LMG 32447]CAH1856590.1 hypothetical protein LMG032447_01322 [Convivina sp. LMG 32447]CAH1856882.1 hypothetical protein R078138_01461 [Convivina sp. LMG 32447]